MDFDEPIELPIQKQHYVPEGYLKSFTFDGKHFYHRYKKGYNSFKSVSTNSVCCIPNYYDLHGTGLSEEYGLSIRFLEKEFQKYETVLPSILERIRSKPPFLTYADFGLIVEAYLSIKHRNPSTRSHLEKMATDPGMISETIDKIINENPTLPALVTLYGQDIDKIRKDALTNALADKNVGKKTHLNGLVQNSLNANLPIKEARIRLNEMNVQVIEAPDGHYFFTSDNPGYTGDIHYRSHNTGFGFVQSVYFPINSKQLIRLYGYQHNGLLMKAKRVTYITVPPIEMSYINSNTYLFAAEQVFCSNKEYLKAFKPLFGD